MKQITAFIFVAALAISAYAANTIIGVPQLYPGADGVIGVATNALSPNDEQTLAFTVSDADGLTDVKSIYIYFYHSSTGYSSSDSPALHATFHVTINSTAVAAWAMDGPGSCSWAIDDEHCSPATISGTSATFKLVFTPGKVARYSRWNEWQTRIVAYDMANTRFTNEAAFNCAEYINMSVQPSTAYFIKGQSGQTRALDIAGKINAYNEGYISVNVTANCTNEIGLQFGGFYTTNGSAILDISSATLSGRIDADTFSVVDSNFNAIAVSLEPSTSDSGDFRELALLVTYTNTVLSNFISKGILKVENISSASPVWRCSASLTFHAGTVAAVAPTFQDYVYLYDDDNGYQNPNNRTTALTAGDEQTLAFYINDKDGFADITSLSVVFWHEPSTTVNASDNRTNHATYWWDEHDNFWHVDSTSGWSLDYLNSTVVSNYRASAENQKILLVFTPSAFAHLDEDGGWRVTILATSYNPDGGYSVIEKTLNCVEPEITPSTVSGSQGQLIGAPAPFLPNASSSSMTFRYNTSDAGILTLIIYDIGGEQVKTIADNESVDGDTTWTAAWDGINDYGLEASSGVYYAEISIRKNDGTIEGPKSFMFALVR